MLHPSTLGFKDWVDQRKPDLEGVGRKGRGAPQKSADLGLGLLSLLRVTQGGLVGSPSRALGQSWNNSWQLL